MTRPTRTRTAQLGYAIYSTLRRAYGQLPVPLRRAVAITRYKISPFIRDVRSSPREVAWLAVQATLRPFSRPRRLYHDIAKTFGVSERFVRLWLESQGHLAGGPAQSWGELRQQLDPMQRMYIEFAMTTVSRGRSIAELLVTHGCVGKKGRYLDVGTGYGGFLRVFGEIGFDEVIGIELQGDLAALAEANIYGRRKARIIGVDFESTECPDLGTFDLITCNDVIEHVQAPAVTIDRMADMLAEGGCLCLEIPNANCVSFVESDGHFRLLGITQLRREDAATYYAEALGTLRRDYFVLMGDYYELDWYLQRLAGHGLTAEILDTHRAVELSDVPRRLASLRESLRRWHGDVAPKISPAVAALVASRVEEYLSQVEADHAALVDEASAQRFVNRYLRTFWTVLAHRPGEPGGNRLAHTPRPRSTLHPADAQRD